ncbi:MAG TPA: YciI family protein [Steroidobacteraceae bacterium]|jgi:uncharacterized protein YciI
MYFVKVSYIRPIEQVEEHLEAHRRFLDKQYEKGIFLASGARIPRTGGAFLVRGLVSRTELDSLMKEDPFHQHQVASYEITEFTPSKYDAGLKDLL